MSTAIPGRTVASLQISPHWPLSPGRGILLVPHTALRRGSMGRRWRRRVESTDDWELLELLCAWEGQKEYERIRPLVLFGSSPAPGVAAGAFRLLRGLGQASRSARLKARRRSARSPATPSRLADSTQPQASASGGTCDLFSGVRGRKILRSSTPEVATWHTKICRVAYMLCPVPALQSDQSSSRALCTSPLPRAARLFSCLRRGGPGPYRTSP
jgi:hypothetical protein